MDASQRDGIRDALSDSERQRLIVFAHRSALLALQKTDASLVRRGLVAISMLDQTKMDFREIDPSLLHHAAARLGLDVEQLFRQAAGLAEPGTASMLIAAQQRTRSPHGPYRHCCSHMEVVTDNGIGFLQLAFGDHDASPDLVRTGIAAARLLNQEGRYAAAINAKGHLPTVWFGKAGGPPAEPIKRRITSAINVDGSLLNNELVVNGDHVRSWLGLFLVALPSTEDAAHLTRLVDQASHDFATVASLAQGNVFCLLVAAASHANVPPPETRASLRGFAQRLKKQLAAVGFESRNRVSSDDRLK